MDLQLHFMVNNAPKRGLRGVSKHNVPNLSVPIQEYTDHNAKFKR